MSTSPHDPYDAGYREGQQVRSTMAGVDALKAEVHRLREELATERTRAEMYATLVDGVATALKMKVGDNRSNLPSRVRDAINAAHEKQRHSDVIRWKQLGHCPVCGRTKETP